MSDQKQQRKRKGLSIFYRTLMLFLLLIIGISGILTGVFYIFSERSFESRIKESLLQQLDSIESHLHSELRAPLIKDLHLLTSNPSMDEYMMSNRPEKYVTARAVEKLFLETITYTNSYKYICFTNSEGIQEIKVDTSGRLRQYGDLSNTALFSRIESGPPGGIVVGDLQKSDEGGWMFAAGASKTDPDIGEFGGAIIIHIYLENFLSHLDSVKILGNDPVWVLSPDDTVLRMPAKEAGVLDPRSLLPGAFVTHAALKEGEEGMLVFKDIHINPDKPLFRLVISVPRTLIMKDLHSTLKALYLVFAIAVIMISPLAYYFSRRLSSPLVKLAQAAIRLSKRDMSTRLHIEAGGEVGILVDEFNAMAENLERTTVSKNYIDNIISSMNESLIVLDTGGIIKSVNDATLSLLGYAEEDLVGRPADRIIYEKRLLDHRNNTTMTGDDPPSGIETVYLTRSRGEVPVLFSSSLLHDDAGDIQGTVCVAQDITERKKAEDDLREFTQKLKRSNEELEQFAYIASHDLQEPLRKVTAFGDRLKNKYSGVLGEQGADYLERMQSAARRMQSLINGLLAYSRVTTKAQPLVPTDLSKVVKDVLADLEIRIEQVRGRVETGKLPTIDVDPLQIRQLMQNLIGNALKFSKEDEAPVVKVHGRFLSGGRPERADAYFQLTVEDNGIGFDERYAERIFGVFQRLHGRSEYEGTGIGLSVCKKIVERHRGSISAKSEPGKGSSFIVSLPVRPDASINHDPDRGTLINNYSA